MTAKEVNVRKRLKCTNYKLQGKHYRRSLIIADKELIQFNQSIESQQEDSKRENISE